jgi:hypothetical protein
LPKCDQKATVCGLSQKKNATPNTSTAKAPTIPQVVISSRCLSLANNNAHSGTGGFSKSTPRSSHVAKILIKSPCSSLSGLYAASSGSLRSPCQRASIASIASRAQCCGRSSLSITVDTLGPNGRAQHA